jgi:hypothetical protein
VLLNQENVRKWFADWTARYEKAVRESATAQAIDRDFQQLRRDFPDLDRYLNLAAEANSILEGFRGHKAIAAYAAQVRILASDPYYVRDSSQLGALFQRRIGALLDATNYKATIELHEERLAALMAADAGLSSASQTQSAADANLRAYTSQVYRAVQTCLNQYGASCNPYLFAPAMALVNDPANIAVIDRTANLAEDAGTASFNFSTSEKYKALADSSARAVQDDLAKVQAYIEQAVRDYLSAYNALPAVRAVEQLWEELIGILFSESRRLGVVAAEIESLLRKLANQ